MATRKTEKDKKIAYLQEENRALKRQWAFATWVSGLTTKKRLLIALYATVLLIGGGLLFTEAVIRITIPENMTQKEYEVVLSEVVGRNWKVGKGYRDVLSKHTHGTAEGYAYTRREGDGFSLILYGELDIACRFSYREGKIMGFLSSYPSTLTYSESPLKSGRALTILVGEDKIVFYEEK